MEPTFEITKGSTALPGLWSQRLKSQKAPQPCRDYGANDKVERILSRVLNTVYCILNTTCLALTLKMC
ncbi:MAG: hypothetical protein U9P70_05305 [Patescibacteria group bacterium]|nr:hypothetical protein [Patescibacteria group bacterium]